MFERLMNPFIVGRPVPAHKFIGRRRDIRDILSQLANPMARSGSAIIGSAHSGKTSLLHYIFDLKSAAIWQALLDQCIFVLIDARKVDSYVRDRLMMISYEPEYRGMTSFRESEFWRYVIGSLIIHCHSKLHQHLQFMVNLLIKSCINTNDLDQFFSQIAQDNKCVVILLDRGDWLITSINPQHPTLLRTLCQLIDRPAKNRGLSLIITSEEPLAVFNLSSVFLKPFSEDEGNELIDEYLRETSVRFTQQDKDFALELSSREPYWLQRVCSKLFQRHTELTNGQLPESVHAEIRAEIAEEMKSKGGLAMTSTIDQLALTVLAQATQFLFDELGRRLDFWRKKKGEQATPESVEAVSQPDGVVVKLDDLERQIDVQRLLLKREDIEVSMHVIRDKKRTVGELRKQAAKPLISHVEKAKIEAGIKGIEDEITLESNKLEALLKEVYGESSD